jgi:hypothetical protein
VVAHYVSKDWLLEKRVIGLRLIETSHTGENIAERVMTVLENYGVVNKAFLSFWTMPLPILRQWRSLVHYCLVMLVLYSCINIVLVIL